MWKENQVKKWLALIIIILIVGVVFYALKPYLNAFLGSLILFVLFKPLHNWLVEVLKLSRGIAAALVIIISLILFLAPLTFLLSIIIDEAQTLIPAAITQLNNNQYIHEWLGRFGDTSIWVDQLSKAGPAAKNFLFGTLSAVSNQVITAVIMYFTLYFLLATEEEKSKEFVFDLVPFSQKNTLRLAQEFRNVTYSTIITSGLIAIVQGSLITIGFSFLHVPGAFLWGFVASLLSFVPFLGVPSIWIPTTIYLFLMGRIWASAAFLGWGTFISNIDNVLRPIIQKKVGQIHPLQSLLGIFVGLSLFGLIGIVLGPLLLSYFVLTVKMFREEYIK